MKYTFGNLEFTSKEKATQFFRSRFQKIYDNQEELNQEDKDMLKTLLSGRTDFGEEYLLGITDFRLVQNPKNPKAMETQFLHESIWVPFSIERCVVGRPHTQNHNNNKSFREIIDPQIKEFYAQNENRVCKLCSKTTSIQVDHFSPSFHEMVKSFCHVHNINQNEPLSEAQITEFGLYHKRVANLRYLCAQCNLQTYLCKGKGRPQIRSKEDAVALNRERAKARHVRLLKPSGENVEENKE